MAGVPLVLAYPFDNFDFDAQPSLDGWFGLLKRSPFRAWDLLNQLAREGFGVEAREAFDRAWGRADPQEQRQLLAEGNRSCARLARLDTSGPGAAGSRRRGDTLRPFRGSPPANLRDAARRLPGVGAAA